MSFARSIHRAVVLLLFLFCARPALAQDTPRHRCFEQPDEARDALRRLPRGARDWLAEDAAYIITPNERCAFLHLNTDEERQQFIEQFWYRRSIDPVSREYIRDFKTEHYRRIVFANENYGAQIAGWKTDRGRIYVVLGSPDSVDLVASQRAPDVAGDRGSGTNLSNTPLRPAEIWHYCSIAGIGQDVDFHFQPAPGRVDYVLAAQDQNLLAGYVDVNPVLRTAPGKIELYVAGERPPEIKFKDLEGLIVARVLRDQVKFSHRFEFAAATRATTLARIHIEIACAACTRAGVVPSVAYPVLIYVRKPSGWVVHVSEQTADTAVRDKSDPAFHLTAQFDVPLTPGTYQLAVATKNAATGEAGVLLAPFDVPTSESLGMKN